MHDNPYKCGLWVAESDRYLNDNQCICAGYLTLMQYQHFGELPLLPTLDDAIYAIANTKLKPVTADILAAEVRDNGPLATRPPHARLLLSPMATQVWQNPEAVKHALALVDWDSTGVSDEVRAAYRSYQVDAIKTLVAELPHVVMTPTCKLAELDKQWCDVLAPVVVAYALQAFGWSDFFAFELKDSKAKKVSAVREGLLDHGRSFEALAINTEHTQLLKRAAFAQCLRRLPDWAVSGAGKCELSAPMVADLARLCGIDSEV